MSTVTPTAATLIELVMSDQTKYAETLTAQCRYCEIRPLYELDDPTESEHFHPLPGQHCISMICADDIPRFFDGFGLGNVAIQVMELVNQNIPEPPIETPPQSANQTLATHTDHQMIHVEPERAASPPPSNVDAGERSRGGSSDELAGAEKPHFDEEDIRAVEAEFNDLYEEMCAEFLKVYEDAERAEREFLNKSQ